MKIVILEDNEERRALMRTWLQDRFYQFDVRFFDTARDTIEFLDVHLEDTILICLDHDLEMQPGQNGTWIDPGTGRDVADYLATKSPHCPVVIHSTNSDAVLGMKMALQDAGWKTKRVVPFDDLEWISSCWFPTIRRVIVDAARPAVAKD